MRKKIILFTRIPSLGQVKTRLRGILNEDERLDLIKRLLSGIVEEIRKTSIPWSIHYEGDPKDLTIEVENLVPQEGQDLGLRMLGAIDYELRENEAVVLVGSDLLDLDKAYIEEAFSALESHDLVLGPTEDGGYGLIGMKSPHDVFSAIRYSQSDVCSKTIEKAKDLDLSYHLLDKIRDIDVPEDLIREEVGASKVEVLGHGEYNMNYRYDDDFVFRMNLGSQLHLGDEQIFYEYGALKQLEDTGVTPKVYKVEKKGDWVPRPYLTMEFLQGRPLDYDRDMETGAYLLAKIHNHLFSKEGMIFADRPFKVMYEEFTTMFGVYRAWEEKRPETEDRILKLLTIAKSRGLEDEISRPCLINTELNNRNFIIGPTKEESFVIDWEKPIIGDCEQDLAHFTVPTTTNWKTDKILTRKEIDSFLDEYEKYRKLDRVLYDKYYMFNCLRGITWCSMAKVEYSSDRTLTNEETLEKINLFISDDFIDFIYKEFYEVYDDK